MNTQYELAFITQNNDKDVLAEVEKTVESVEGKVEAKDSLGKKTFSYVIKGLSSGHYHIWNVSMSGKSVATLKSKLNLNDTVVRYLLLTQ